MVRVGQARHRRWIREQAGFTLIELLIVVAIIGILASIGVALYANVQARARIARAQADTRAVASAVSIYSAHCGDIPPVGGGAGNCPGAAGAAGTGGIPLALTVTQTNTQGQVAGPFLAGIPAPSNNWAGGTAGAGVYGYTSNANGTFVVCGAGDGAVARSDGGAAACP